MEIKGDLDPVLEIDGATIGLVILPAESGISRKLVAIEFEDDAVFIYHGEGPAFVFHGWGGEESRLADMGVMLFHPFTQVHKKSQWIHDFRSMDPTKITLYENY